MQNRTIRTRATGGVAAPSPTPSSQGRRALRGEYNLHANYGEKPEASVVTRSRAMQRTCRPACLGSLRFDRSRNPRSRVYTSGLGDRFGFCRLTPLPICTPLRHSTAVRDHTERPQARRATSFGKSIVPCSMRGASHPTLQNRTNPGAEIASLQLQERTTDRAP